VASEVVKILFLGKDVGLGNFLAAGETPEDDRPIGLRRQLGAAFRVDAIGLALAALLGSRGSRNVSQAEQSPKNPCC